MSTRERLIESTQDLLWERGYVGTSPKAIQRQAEAGQGSMYHHFAGKPDLALAAIRRNAEQLREEAEACFALDGTAPERIVRYLLRQRDVLRGCRVGRLAADPDIIANSALREPLDETFGWLQRRLADILAEGQARGEVAAGLDPEDVAAAIIAVVQGGYVLARAAGTAEPFGHAISGLLALLTIDHHMS